MKILILGDNWKKWNWGHSLFRKSFERHHDVAFYGPEYKEYISVENAVNEFKPDIIFSNYSGRMKDGFSGLNKIIKIPKVIRPYDYVRTVNPNWQGTGIVKIKDYKASWRNYFKVVPFNLYFGENRLACDNMIKDGIAKIVHLLPFSVETNLYKPSNVKKNIDIMAAFNAPATYPLRKKIIKMVKEMPLESIAGERVVIYEKYIDAINRSKIFITSNNQLGSISMKYTEVLACGTFLLCDEPKNYQELGYENGKHFVIWKDLNDLKDKIWYYLKHKDERKKIAENGMKFVRKNHSNDKRIEEWTKIIKEKIFKK